jgi:hypothetical protein
MLNRKEGLEPKIPLIEINQWTNDCLSADKPEYGFGVMGYLWKAYRQRWWKDGFWRTFRSKGPVTVPMGEPRPRWKRETVEAWTMLNLDITVWSRIYNVSIRLKRAKWTEPTKFS